MQRQKDYSFIAGIIDQWKTSLAVTVLSIQPQKSLTINAPTFLIFNFLDWVHL